MKVMCIKDCLGCRYESNGDGTYTPLKPPTDYPKVPNIYTVIDWRELKVNGEVVLFYCLQEFREEEYWAQEYFAELDELPAIETKKLQQLTY